jgi:phosphoribosylformimino-5-aminoimidazole carboxamide ribotide isomerase
MRVIGVLDLRRGQAVHAQGGRRDRYEPIVQVAAELIERGSARAVARAYVDRFGIDEIYVADLDAVEGLDPQAALVADVASMDVHLWVDAGVTSPLTAYQAANTGASHVIVGLETLPGWDALSAVVAALGSNRVAFSLDLRAGVPMLAPGSQVQAATPSDLVRRAVDAGASALIVLDVERVGAGTGVDVALVRELRSSCPDLEILAGGGVGSVQDLERLSDAGCDGALVASALLDGRLRPEHLHGRVTR